MYLLFQHVEQVCLHLVVTEDPGVENSFCSHFNLLNEFFSCVCVHTCVCACVCLWVCVELSSEARRGH